MLLRFAAFSRHDAADAFRCHAMVIMFTQHIITYMLPSPLSMPIFRFRRFSRRAIACRCRYDAADALFSRYHAAVSLCLRHVTLRFRQRFCAGFSLTSCRLMISALIAAFTFFFFLYYFSFRRFLRLLPTPCRLRFAS